jgi:hypothetical protein
LSAPYISAALRREVIARAAGCCEYCLTDTQDRAIDYAIDHVIAVKHGGPTQLDNLCLSCYGCNSYKGSDLSSVDWDEDAAIIPLFNPRQQMWNKHFQLDGVLIVPLNASERIKERALLTELGVYPCKRD